MPKKELTNTQLMKAISKMIGEQTKDLRAEMKEGFHQQGALLEDVYEKIKILSEGQASLNERLERVEVIIPTIEKIEIDIGILKTEVRLIRQPCIFGC